MLLVGWWLNRLQGVFDFKKGIGFTFQRGNGVGLRRAFVILVSVIITTLGIGTPVGADNGPHGEYSAMTDKCAACHRAHTAKGEYLLTAEATAMDKSAFCFSCHSGGSGAYTDVKNGLFLTAATVVQSYESTTVPGSDRPLMGGGFENVRMNAALTGTLNLAVTSNHMVSGGASIVWGYGPTTTVPNVGAASISLTCTNCHNPHGRAGTGNTATYRILKGNSADNSPLFANGMVTQTSSVDVPDESFQSTIPGDPATRDYFIENTNKSYYYKNGGAGYPDSYFAQHVELTSGCSGCHPTHGSTISIYARLTQWCAQCHTRDHTGSVSSPGHTDSGDTVFQFRHKTNLNSPPPGAVSDCRTCHRTHGAKPRKTYPGCLTCHVAHGTGARMGDYSGEVSWPGGTTLPNGDERSSLLRLDNRGVCLQCHPWGTGQEGY